MGSQARSGPVRIGGAQGGFADRQHAYHDLAKSGLVDVIIGDSMSECTITINSSAKAKNTALLASDPTTPASSLGALFDPTWLQGCLAPALPWCEKNGVKIAVNAGASAPDQLAKLVKSEIERQGLKLKVAWVEGDDVSEQVFAARKTGDKFASLDTGKTLSEWGCEPIAAQCYLGGMGIAAALRAGADIVVCGRVADASPAVGAAAWWHDWSATQFDELASALIAGHLIECSTYATGGYYSGFKDLFDNCEDLGYPVAAIEANGDTVLTKEQGGKGGEMSVGTLTSQLVYEIQGPLYYNSDVIAQLEGVKLEQIGKDEVRMSGIKGLPPPSTTKVGVTGHGGYQAEFHYLFVGLDIEKKVEWTERQIRHSMRNHIDKFSVLKFHTIGTAAADPSTQDSATVDFRIFVQTKDPSILGLGNWASLGGDCFSRWCMQNFLTSAPGASVTPDGRQSSGKAILEYWPTLLPQNVVKQKAVMEWSGEIIDIPSPENTSTFKKQQNSYDTKNPVELSSFGPTTRGPLGWVVMGRSGDKASDANVGFFVRHDDEWDWLRSLLSLDKFLELMGKEYLGNGVDRFEMANIRAVHFLVRDHLDRGFNSTSSMDALGKNLCEYLRAKYVDIPNKFLERGKI